MTEELNSKCHGDDEEWSDWSDEETDTVNKSLNNVSVESLITNLNMGIDSFSSKFKDAGRREMPVHLRFKKRTGKKVLTIVEGLENDEVDKYLKKWKKSFCCGGSKIEEKIQIDNDIKKRYVLQFTGDCRGRIKDYLIENNIVDKDDIKIHGPQTNDNN